ncbi:hypothetical protein RHGRI_000036 [Rhododendron griersonianum]|uniref:Uncharacterized protein n=1 Tax=Rhododendron griersonianum TaxID=479676 RepID=A0AAV6LHS9_9ERIC|nr:hypothetical protein RHGRI_000036 [Rhododendron griersonianum]
MVVLHSSTSDGGSQDGARRTSHTAPSSSSSLTPSPTYLFLGEKKMRALLVSGGFGLGWSDGQLGILALVFDCGFWRSDVKLGFVLVNARYLYLSSLLL